MQSTLGLRMDIRGLMGRGRIPTMCRHTARTVTVLDTEKATGMGRTTDTTRTTLIMARQDTRRVHAAQVQRVTRIRRLDICLRCPMSRILSTRRTRMRSMGTTLRTPIRMATRATVAIQVL
jgi:hypothetical protein